MTKWKQTSIGEFIDFNPTESIKKGTLATKVGMDKLGTFQRKINGSEKVEYNGGPKFRNTDTVVAKITPCLENGKTAYVDILEENEVAFGSSEFIVLRKNECSDSKFIYYLARSPLFREKAISCMEGTSGRKRVNEGALKRQEILIPSSVTQQQKIASILSSLDDKIELNSKINDNLERMAKTLYDYWFVQFDFPNENGKPYKSSGGKMIWNEILKREIPEGWEVKKIREICSTGSGGTPKSTEVNYYENGKIPWLNSGELNKTFIISTTNFITELGMKNSSAKLFPSNIILMAMYGATAGKTSIVSFETTTNQAVCAIIPNDHLLFHYIKFSLDNMYRYLVNLSTGSARDNLSQDKIRDLNTIIPAERTIRDFSNTVIILFNKIKNNHIQNQQLSSLRDWLLPMLMNGQVKIE
ncbi:restriction endonuclease subunit S [Elizabethkingia anophelis]|uniref:restriction endonuclease subunit S n=1 Tax=Elizabethkingia anophelis TaxID=1117645 RepID=UPI002011EDC4|nr:restriction endonuclease subunit S [Elizabethkingia anophelis]MCL1647666.1 restriction endonuclease subunit S [Elizabethkingia anophelis]MDV3962474.1 type I restriction endonuclease [Elizabethkingia anophelis]